MSAEPTAVRIAVIADTHYGSRDYGERRTCDADARLHEAVQRLNRLRPHLTAVLGDMLDDGNAPDAHERRARLRETLDGLRSPTIVLPGNHDGNADAFYVEFERPPAWVDINGVRFLPFVDRDEPDCNASREAADLARFQEARRDFAGPLVALQHVCLVPPALANVPYNYLNAESIIVAMVASGTVLSISGHHHPGAENVRLGSLTFVNAPGLCEPPYAFLVVTLDRGRVVSARHTLEGSAPGAP
jgi:3',5'-cyclic AMP phosphodiesterase CpdA